MSLILILISVLFIHFCGCFFAFFLSWTILFLFFFFYFVFSFLFFTGEKFFLLHKIAFCCLFVILDLFFLNKNEVQFFTQVLGGASALLYINIFLFFAPCEKKRKVKFCVFSLFYLFTFFGSLLSSLQVQQIGGDFPSIVFSSISWIEPKPLLVFTLLYFLACLPHVFTRVFPHFDRTRSFPPHRWWPSFDHLDLFFLLLLLARGVFLNFSLVLEVSLLFFYCLILQRSGNRLLISTAVMYFIGILVTSIPISKELPLNEIKNFFLSPLSGALTIAALFLINEISSAPSYNNLKKLAYTLFLGYLNNCLIFFIEQGLTPTIQYTCIVGVTYLTVYFLYKYFESSKENVSYTLLFQFLFSLLHIATLLFVKEKELFFLVGQWIILSIDLFVLSKLFERGDSDKDQDEKKGGGDSDKEGGGGGYIQCPNELNQRFSLLKEPKSSPLEQFSILPFLPFHIGNFYFSFTNSSLYMLITCSLASLSFNLIKEGGKLVPNAWQSLVELLYSFVLNLVNEQIGGLSGNVKQKFFPLILVTFLFLLFSNLQGMIPYSFTVTSHFLITLGLSFSLFIGITLVGFQKNGLHFLSFLLPAGVPLPLAPFLVLLELISYCFRALSLGIRLFANMMAGHSLVKILSGFAWTMLSMNNLFYFIGGFGPFFIVLALTGLELGVAILQAYVFTILISIYLNDAINLH